MLKSFCRILFATLLAAAFLPLLARAQEPPSCNLDCNVNRRNACTLTWKKPQGLEWSNKKFVLELTRVCIDQASENPEELQNIARIITWYQSNYSDELAPRQSEKIEDGLDKIAELLDATPTEIALSPSDDRPSPQPRPRSRPSPRTDELQDSLQTLVSTNNQLIQEIDSLQQVLVSQNNRLSNLEGNQDSLWAQIGAINQQLSRQAQTIAQLQSSMQNLENAVEALSDENRKLEEESLYYLDLWFVEMNRADSLQQERDTFQKKLRTHRWLTPIWAGAGCAACYLLRGERTVSSLPDSPPPRPTEFLP